MTIIRHDDLPTKRTYVTKSLQRRFVDASAGAGASTIGEECIPPGGGILPHYHDVEETLVFLSGECEATLGDRTERIGPETSVFIPPGVVHSVRNTGDRTVRLLAFFPKLNPAIIHTQHFFEGPWADPARTDLVARYGNNQTPWYRWLGDRLNLAPGQRVLDIGCGDGAFWEHNLDRIPADWDITLADWRPDMVAAAKARLAGRHPGLSCAALDANAIDRPDGHFDAVFAFHLNMSPAERLVELRRVLRPGGRFCATTVGADYLREMAELVRRCDPDADLWGLFPREPFYLENGAEQLAPLYAGIESHRYANALVVDRPGPIIDFVRTTNGRSVLAAGDEAFTRVLAAEIAARGAIEISHDYGLFIATKTPTTAPPNATED